MLTVLSVWVIPPVLRGQIQRRTEEALGRPVSVGRVAFNPLRLVVTIDGLEVREVDGSAWLGWDRLRVNLQAWALVRGVLGFDAIELDGFEARIAIDSAGRLNFADLLPEEPAEAESAEGDPLAVLIGSLAIRDARILFVDASRGGEAFVTTLGPLSFSLEGFHTVGDPNAPYDFVARTEAGETLSWRGTLSATPLRSQGSIELGGIQLRKYAPYYREFTGAEVRDGALHFVADYALEVSGTGVGVALTKGNLRLDDLALGQPGVADPLVSVPQLEAIGLGLDWSQQTLAVESLVWTGGRVRLVQDDAGLNLVKLLVPGGGGDDHNSASTSQPGLRVTVGSTELKDVAVQWRDETLSKPAEVDVASLSATVKAVDSARLDRMVQVGVDAVLANGGGTMRAIGEASVAPFRPALDVELDRLMLALGNAYLRDAVGYELEQGQLSLGGSLGAVNGALVFRGNAALSATKLQAAAGEKLAQWESLSVEGVSLVLEPLTVEVDQVRWVRPDLMVRIAPDGRLNWAPTSPSEVVAAAPSIAPLPVIRVNRVELVQARLDFADASLVRPAVSLITDLSGELTGLSSVELAKGKASLRGKANGSGGIAIEGDFNPLGRPAYTDLTIDFDRVDLSPLDGYVSHYAGYALQHGRLTLDIDFKLKDRVIRSESVATLDGFTLGSKVDSPDATGLPVPLALKLLRDGKGQIVIDIPVAGELDDPEFRIGRVVWRVIGNLLTKAATAPFALLGSLVGGGAPEDLDEQLFAAAQTSLSETAIQKLDTLATALNDRPGLTLGIRGEYEAQSDALAWRPQVLEERLQERATSGEWTPQGGWVGKARTGQLVNLYLQVFGEPPVESPANESLVQAAVEPPVKPAVQANAQPDGGTDETLVGWLRRVLGGSKRSTGDVEAGPEENPQPAVARPESVLPAMVVLPDEEIARRLIEAVQVGEEELRSLATARAAAVRDHLIAKGISPSRLVVEEPLAGAARVKLDLR